MNVALELIRLLLGLPPALLVGRMVKTIDWSTAFFAGYSIDGCMELYLERFAQAAIAGVRAIQSRIRVKLPA